MTTKIKTPSFIIIPKEVILSKKIRQADKLIYGAIYWYDKMKEGICFASNNALAEAVGVSSRSVQECLTRLENASLIKRLTTGKKRTIRPLIGDNVNTSFDDIKENDTSNDNKEIRQMTTSNTSNDEQSSNKNKTNEYDYDNNKLLPEQLGNSPLKRIIKFYSIVWKETYGTPYNADYGKIGRLLKKTIIDYTEWQIACFIMTHFEWYGASGEDEFAHKRLAESCFPLEWIPNNINQYLAYLVNNLRIEMDKPEQVKQHVVDFVNSINK